MATVTHEDIYKEVRAYLLGLFSCPPETVIEGYQNDSPLPENAVVMTILFEAAFDVSSNYYDEINEIATVQQSVEATMQIDFYGAEASSRARKISNLWKNHYSTARFTVCQPLYSKDPRRMVLVNEKSIYEDRWSVDVLLQYNPEFEYDQTYLDLPTITLIKGN